MTNETHWPGRPRCHGCGGKGWIDSKLGVRICPICRGLGEKPAPPPVNRGKYWRL